MPESLPEQPNEFEKAEFRSEQEPDPVKREILGYVEQKIRGEDQLKHYYERLLAQGKAYDPEDVKAQRPGKPLQTLSARMEEVENALNGRGKVLQIWPMVMRPVIDWNPEKDIEPLKIKSLDVTVVEFLDDIIAKDPNVGLAFGNTLIDFCYDAVGSLKPENKTEIIKMMYHAQKANTILKETELFSDPTYFDEHVLGQKTQNAAHIRNLQEEYVNLHNYFSNEITKLDNKNT